MQCFQSSSTTNTRDTSSQIAKKNNDIVATVANFRIEKNQPCSLFDCYYNIRCTPAGVTHVSRTWNSINSFNQPPPGEFQNLTTYSTLLVNETSPFYEITYWSLFIFPYNEKIFPSEHSNNNSLQVVEIFSTFYSSFFQNPVLPSSNSNWLTIELGL